MIDAVSVGGGIAHAESPECTPASSMCSMTPPMSTSPVWSRNASTSTSVASSRNRSTSAGTFGRRPPSRPRLPPCASSAIARREVVGVVDDLHRAAAEHVRRPHEHRVTRRRRARRSRALRRRRIAVPPGGCGMPRRSHERVELFAVLGEVDRRGWGAEHWNAGPLQLVRQLQAASGRRARRSRRRSRPRPASAAARKPFADVHHVFGRERFEEQSVTRVVVGRHRLGVAIDHHRLVAGIGERERRRARSSSRTRRPGRCGSVRCRGSRPRGR